MKVLQLIDTLNAGGAERMAVNYANALSSRIEASHICATRLEGSLKDLIEPEVNYLYLNKKSSVDMRAVAKLGTYVKKNNIDIVHAHSSSFFTAVLAKLFFLRTIKIVWHDHYGNSEFLESRKRKALVFFSRYFSHIIVVNQFLLDWSERFLKCKNLSFLPNFASLGYEQKPKTQLQGIKGKRIVCLANLREQKDHANLIEAFIKVYNKFPDWSLHLIGKDFKDKYSEAIKTIIENSNLTDNIFMYGSKGDIHHILNQATIGVLSSKSEGLPVSLLEYGLAGLAVVATKVGEIESVITDNEHGLLVAPEESLELSNAIITLIQSEEQRDKYSKNLHIKVIDEYSESAVIKGVISIYNSVLS